MGGGVIPVSAVLADKEVMLCIQPGEHGRFAFILLLLTVSFLTFLLGLAVSHRMLILSSIVTKNLYFLNWNFLLTLAKLDC